ncbi:ECHDC1 [Cervus elaphus hippelaphus]|uniref:ECHDC1 n=1 Tax=Cervus elaphus hippelaphus TaxID=46360 RepID=A0A212C5P6_CEREH|nr:ECHDC1 [Cervus elaphus hippelaphus]
MNNLADYPTLMFQGPGLERLMTTDSEIRFVHKEMGIIPSWGGATRLVKIIGSRQALKVLSGALKLDSEKALRIGMVEDILQASDETECLKEAQEWLQQFIKGPPETKPRVPLFTLNSSDGINSLSSEISVASIHFTPTTGGSLTAKNIHDDDRDRLYSNKTEETTILSVPCTSYSVSQFHQLDPSALASENCNANWAQHMGLTCISDSLEFIPIERLTHFNINKASRQSTCACAHLDFVLHDAAEWGSTDWERNRSEESLSSPVDLETVMARWLTELLKNFLPLGRLELGKSVDDPGTDSTLNNALKNNLLRSESFALFRDFFQPLSECNTEMSGNGKGGGARTVVTSGALNVWFALMQADKVVYKMTVICTGHVYWRQVSISCMRRGNSLPAPHPQHNRNFNTVPPTPSLIPAAQQEGAFDLALRR